MTKELIQEAENASRKGQTISLSLEAIERQRDLIERLTREMRVQKNTIKSLTRAADYWEQESVKGWQMANKHGKRLVAIREACFDDR